jgi:hypothetical protein
VLRQLSGATFASKTFSRTCNSSRNNADDALRKVFHLLRVVRSL